MTEASLPFNERYSPSIAKFSNGQIRKQESEKSLKNPQEYWSEKAKAIDWFKQPSKALDDSNPPFYKWFPDGELNICYNALDRHIKGPPQKQACLHLGRRNGRSKNLHLLSTLP